MSHIKRNNESVTPNLYTVVSFDTGPVYKSQIATFKVDPSSLPVHTRNEERATPVHTSILNFILEYMSRDVNHEILLEATLGHEVEYIRMVLTNEYGYKASIVRINHEDRVAAYERVVQAGVSTRLNHVVRNVRGNKFSIRSDPIPTGPRPMDNEFYVDELLLYVIACRC
jgi:hypothetical protein